MDRVFQTFGGFTSGIGIHYAPSTIVKLPRQGNVEEASKKGKGVKSVENGGPGVGGEDVHQAATALVVGQRMPPSVVITAANYRPKEVQDLLVSNMKFKLLVFCGDLSRENERQMARLQGLAEKLGGQSGFLRKFVPKGMDVADVFEIFSIGWVFLKYRTRLELRNPERLRRRKLIIPTSQKFCGLTGPGNYSSLRVVQILREILQRLYRRFMCTPSHGRQGIRILWDFIRGSNGRCTTGWLCGPRQFIGRGG